jgi:hypothetical protein
LIQVVNVGIPSIRPTFGDIGCVSI